MVVKLRDVLHEDTCVVLHSLDRRVSLIFFLFDDNIHQGVLMYAVDVGFYKMQGHGRLSPLQFESLRALSWFQYMEQSLHFVASAPAWALMLCTCRCFFFFYLLIQMFLFSGD